MSDLLFPTWDRRAAGDETKLRGIKYIIQARIENETTEDFIDAATEVEPEDDRTRSGFEFFPHQDEFKVR